MQLGGTGVVFKDALPRGGCGEDDSRESGEAVTVAVQAEMPAAEELVGAAEERRVAFGICAGGRIDPCWR